MDEQLLDSFGAVTMITVSISQRQNPRVETVLWLGGPVRGQQPSWVVPYPQALASDSSSVRAEGTAGRRQQCADLRLSPLRVAKLGQGSPTVYDCTRGHGRTSMSPTVAMAFCAAAFPLPGLLPEEGVQLHELQVVRQAASVRRRGKQQTNPVRMTPGVCSRSGSSNMHQTVPACNVHNSQFGQAG